MSKTRKAKPLSSRLLRMHDEQLRQMARELHDTTSQNLAAILMNLSQLPEGSEALDSPARQTLAQCLALARQCAHEVRRLAHTLHPLLLEEAGLVAALRICAEGYPERWGGSLRLEVPSRRERLPVAVELALFRIAQESLASLRERFGLLRAKLRFRSARKHLTLELSAAIGKQSERQEEDVFLASVRERVRLLGGTLAITTGRGRLVMRAVLPAPLTAPQTAPRVSASTA